MEELLETLLAPVAAGRRAWVTAPQKWNEKPFVLMTRIDGIPSYQYQGFSGYVVSRFQIDVYGETYPQAKATARQINAILSGYRAGIIQAIFIDSERDLPAADAGDVKDLFRVSIDIIVHTGE